MTFTTPPNLQWGAAVGLRLDDGYFSEPGRRHAAQARPAGRRRWPRSASRCCRRTAPISSPPISGRSASTARTRTSAATSRRGGRDRGPGQRLLRRARTGAAPLRPLLLLQARRDPGQRDRPAGPAFPALNQRLKSNFDAAANFNRYKFAHDWLQLRHITASRLPIFLAAISQTCVIAVSSSRDGMAPSSACPNCQTHLTNLPGSMAAACAASAPSS